MATDNTEQIASQPNYLEPQNTQQSETPQLAQTLVDLNQTMSHMAMMLGETLGGHNYHAGTSRSDFFQRGKSNYKGKKGAKYQPPHKK
jgi:hypothetical protein